LPCMATDVGPIREVAGSPTTIRLVPPHNGPALASAINETICGTDLRLKLGAAASSRARQEFSKEVFSRRYAELLHLVSK
jgi:glycosyltransferase involved in cell wall biosynthesis